MEHDDFKKSSSKQSNNKPEISLNNNSVMDVFIDSFKNELKNQRKKSLIWMSYLVMMGIIYKAVSARADDITQIGYHLCIIGFVLGAIYLYFKSRPLPNSVYLLPVAGFMEKAEKKIKFMNLTDWLIVVALLLILGSGGGIIFVTRLLHYIPNITLLIIIWILLFVALSVFAFVVSKKKWKKEHEPLFKEFQNVRESLLGKI